MESETKSSVQQLGTYTDDKVFFYNGVYILVVLCLNFILNPNSSKM